jgi:hypothetical protein
MDRDHEEAVTPPAEEPASSPEETPRVLPTDLPTSLDDRRPISSYGGETEMYDGWQGKYQNPSSSRVADLRMAGSSQYITAPTPARALTFDLHLDTPAYDDEETFARIQDNDSRLMEMVAAQAHHRADGSPGQDEDAIAMDEKLSVDEKKAALQKSLNMAASNGDVARIQKLVGGSAKQYVDVNQTDDEGTVPLIYASCFVGIHISSVSSTD